jgi:hypothetical protein
MPDLIDGPITQEMNQWLGRAAALVELTGDVVNFTRLKVSAQGLNSVLREENAQAIAAVLYEALAKAELNAPADVKGKFIAAGHTFDALMAVGNVLKRAKTDILVVDPYANETVLSDYVILAPENVTVRLLTEANYKQSLKPAAERWVQQFGTQRPLEVRLAQNKALHDREIFVDSTEAWNTGHSLKDLAKKSLTSLSLHERELGTRKIAAYQDIWNASTPL